MASASVRDADGDDRYRDRPMSITTSRTSILDDYNRPLSLISTSSYTPKVNTAARERQRSLATEILGPNHHLVFPSPESSQVDSQDLGRLSSVSGLSEHPVHSRKDATLKPLPSPPAAQFARSPSLSTNFERSIEKSISSPVAVSDSLGFALEGLDRRPSSSMKGVKSPRLSVFIENLEGMNGDIKKPVASSAASSSLATTIGLDLGSPAPSPSPENQVAEISAIPTSEASSAVTEPLQQTASSATVIGPQARKEPRMNFLPKFLRAKSPEMAKAQPVDTRRKRRQKTDGGTATELEERSPSHAAISPKSFFDDESSDGGEEPHIVNAQCAVVTSPVMVHHGSATKVGLKEMLGSTPPVEEQTTNMSQEKATPILGEASGGHDSRSESAHRMYEHPAAEATKDGSLGLASWKELNPFTPDAQRSERSLQYLTPISTPSPAPKPKSARNVSFPPAPLDIQPGHRFLRQSIVSTPYPTSADEERQKRKVSFPKVGLQRGDGPESIFTLVIHSSSNAASPKIKSIVLPNPQLISLTDDSEKNHPPTKATIQTDFDDEKLFTLIRKEYTTLRGPFRHLTSARTVRAINLLSYQSTNQLASKQAKPTHLHPEEGNDEATTEPTLLSLFQTPKLGRKRHEWTNRLRRQPENPSTIPSETDNEKLALEFIESWSPLRLNLALATVILCSLAATLLWVFLGTSKGQHPAANGRNGFAAFGTHPNGVSDDGDKHRGAGGRVGSGAVLGLLVLLLGWTGVAGWVLMSWLVL